MAVVFLLLRPSAPPSVSAGPVPTDAQALAIVANRCAACHALHPTESGYDSPPAGVVLETLADLRRNAAAVRAQAIDSHAMPLGNATGMTQAERDELGRWLAAR
jgi:uncharacterized membrane protein